MSNSDRPIWRIEHDGFMGVEIGSYTTLEGEEGAVLQQIGTRVVHVYRRKWLTNQVKLPSVEVEGYDWKAVVRQAFLEQAPQGVEFVDCDVYDHRRRLEIQYLRPSGNLEVITLRRKDERAMTIDLENVMQLKELAEIGAGQTLK